MSPDTLSLAGKTALITGSGKENGIGAAIARAFARNGASVAIHYVSDSSKARAHKVAVDITKEFGNKTAVVYGPVATPDAAKSIVEQTLKGLETEHIDILVNNAGGASSEQNLLQITQEHIDYDFGVNVFGVIYMAQAAVGVGKMPHGGRIINVGSIASKTGSVGTALYNAAKSAQDSLTDGLAADVSHTRAFLAVHYDGAALLMTKSSLAALINPDGTPNPIGNNMAKLARAADRLGTVEDMADAALLLVSEKSRWITAQWISVSGGVTGAM